MNPRTIAPAAAAFAAAIAVALLGLTASADSPPAGVDSPPSGQDPPPRGGVAHLRLLGVNDFHGHLEPPEPGFGGAAWLAAHLDRATVPGRTIRVHAGDMVGASPLISSHFHDEPSMLVANELRFDVGTLGNHEFDEGGDELIRLLEGGRRSGPEALKRDAGDQLVNTSEPDYPGAQFPFVAANTVDREGQLGVPPYAIVERDGAHVGFIGVTTPRTPNFLLRRYAERFRFTDVSDAVNRWVPELRSRGVEAIVVLAHEGAPEPPPGSGVPPEGPIVGEAREMSPAVDVVVAGHSHSVLNMRLPNPAAPGDKLIVESGSYGTAFDLVDIAVDRRTGEVVEKSARIPQTPHDGVAPDPEAGAIVERYAGLVAPLAKRVVGQLAEPVTKAGGLAGLSAAAQRAFAGTDFAVVRPTSLRGDLPAGPVRYEDVFAAHAYDHPLLRMELPGSQLAGALPEEALDPGRVYSVVISELLVPGAGLPLTDPGGRPWPVVGTEAQALALYLERATARS